MKAAPARGSVYKCATCVYCHETIQKFLGESEWHHDNSTGTEQCPTDADGNVLVD